MSLKTNRRKKNHDYTDSSEHLQKQFDITQTVDLRLGLFVFAIIVAASIIAFRLYQIQIVNQAHYQELLGEHQTPPLTLPTVRGEMFDRNGKVLVSNQASNDITYYSTEKLKAQDTWELALSFSDKFNLDPKLNDNDERELWIFLDRVILETKTEFLSEDELLEYKNGKISDKEVSKMRLERVSAEQLAELTHTQKEAFYTMVKMNNVIMGRSAIVKTDASYEEIAFLVEHQNTFPGFSYQTSWSRNATKDINLNTIFGGLADIPAEKLDYYRALGYEQNDKVGTSGLEYQYESLMMGEKPTYARDQLTGGLTLLNDGRQGYDLRLSIDSDMQKDLEALTTNRLKSYESNSARRYLSQIQFVVSNPQTGDILSMVGIKKDTDGTYYNDPQSVLLEAVPPGSVVKGATVYMGLSEGVITPSTIINDTPMYIEATPPRVSWKPLGNINADQALELSSNIYMFHIAIRLGGTTYIPNGPLIYKDSPAVYNLMRNYYSQFGLGVRTQIDYPREETGYKGFDSTAGKTLEFSIGQYDNYSTLQLNQYISTVANGGKRVAPRLLLDASSKITKSIIYENGTEILNVLPDTASLDVVRQGFHSCALKGSCDDVGLSRSLDYAGKTGTAQDFYWDAANKKLVETATSTYVAFAPFENPQIAVSCVAPHAYVMGEGGRTLYNVCKDMTPYILQNYTQTP